MLPEEVADVVRQAISDRTVEALIGVDSGAAGKTLLGTIKARVREGSFGEALSVRGDVTESSTGKVVVVFSVFDYKPNKPGAGRKPKAAQPVVEEASVPAEPRPEAVVEPAPQAPNPSRRQTRRQSVSV